MSQNDAVALHRTCATCAQPFTVTRGEVQFSSVTGLPMWFQCRRCRPTRRQIAELRAPIAERLSAATPRT